MLSVRKTQPCIKIRSIEACAYCNAVHLCWDLGLDHPNNTIMFWGVFKVSFCRLQWGIMCPCEVIPELTHSIVCHCLWLSPLIAAIC